MMQGHGRMGWHVGGNYHPKKKALPPQLADFNLKKSYESPHICDVQSNVRLSVCVRVEREDGAQEGGGALHRKLNT